MQTSSDVQHYYRFMNERCGFERFTGTVIAHRPFAEFPEFVIDERRKLSGGATVAAVDRVQEPRRVVPVINDI